MYDEEKRQYDIVYRLYCYHLVVNNRTSFVYISWKRGHCMIMHNITGDISCSGNVEFIKRNH